MTTTTAATGDVERIFLSSTEECFARFLLTQVCTGLPHFLWLFVWWPRSSESTLESPDSFCRSVAISTWTVPRSSSLSPAYSLLRWMVSSWASGRSSLLCKSPLPSSKLPYQIPAENVTQSPVYNYYFIPSFVLFCEVWRPPLLPSRRLQYQALRSSCCWLS